ncbi:ARID DNA-binding domain-containing protein [Tanacetum coccineum]
MALNKRFLQKEVFPKLPPWGNQKRKLSPEGKKMLRQKVEEIVSYNSSRAQKICKEKGETSGGSMKERRARCFICKKRGHVLWKCPNKKNKIRSKEPNKIVKPLIVEKVKYPEKVHVIADYMVEGTDDETWNEVWYFKMIGKEENERKFIFSYGLSDATVKTRDGDMVISSVQYTPEVSLNILSYDLLEEQGYAVKINNNICSLKYVYDEKKEGTEKSQEKETYEEGYGPKHVVSEHNKFLDDYFESIDPSEECSLIKGIEVLKMDEGDDQDYIDDEYLSMNGTLYAMKVNTFQRVVSFLNLIKIDKLVYRNWEVLNKKFLEMVEWFYLDYMKQDVLGEIPPVIGVVTVDLLGLYKFVDSLGGYMNVTFNNKWNKVAKLLGLTQDDEQAVKECYKEYIGMVKIYYEEAQRSKQEEPGIEVVGNSSGTAHVKDPLGCAGISVEVDDAQDGTPRKTAQDGVNMDSNMRDTTDEDEQGNTSSSDDFDIIT